MVCVQFINIIHPQTISHHFDQSYQPLVPQHTVLQNCLYQFLKKLIFYEYTIRDSFSFCKEIKDQDSSLFMALFDIQSLFTNNTLDETINICVDQASQNKWKVKGLLIQHFKMTLKKS